MTFADRPIATLAQIEGEIFNDGTEIIRNPTFALTLPEVTAILDSALTPEDPAVTSTVNGNTVTITMPYLNPVRDHHQVLKFSILADGDTELWSVRGGGEGWSLHHIHLVVPDMKRLRAANNLIIYGVPPAVAALYFLNRYLVQTSGVPAGEISWRALAAYAPVYGGFALILGLMGFQAIRMLKITRDSIRRL